MKDLTTVSVATEVGQLQKEELVKLQFLKDALMSKCIIKNLPI